MDGYLVCKSAARTESATPVLDQTRSSLEQSSSQVLNISADNLKQKSDSSFTSELSKRTVSARAMEFFELDPNSFTSSPSPVV